MEKLKLAYFLLPFLGWNTITDLKEGRISFLSVLFFGALGIVLLLCPMGKDLLCQNGSIYVHALGAGIGLLMLLISVATGGGIGVGDGIVAVVLGWYLGIWQVLLLFLFAFFSAEGIRAPLNEQKPFQTETSCVQMPAGCHGE